MNDSSEMNRLDFVVLGVFLTLFVQSQFGAFDGFYDSLLVALALQDQEPWARALFHLLGEHEFAANLRDANPIGFFVLNGAFCAVLAELVSVPIRLLAFTFGNLAAAWQRATVAEEVAADPPAALGGPATS